MKYCGRSLKKCIMEQKNKQKLEKYRKASENIDTVKKS